MTTPTKDTPNAHWTDEQFSNSVLGLTQDPDDHSASLHLDRCAVCRAELERFQISVASFSAVSLAWGERAPAPAAVKPAAHAWTWLPTAGWALAAGLAVGVGVPLAMQPHHASSSGAVAQSKSVATGVQVATNEDENSDAAIARDNRLMMDVAAELSVTEPVPIADGAQTATARKRGNEARQD